MTRHLLILTALTAMLACLPLNSTRAGDGGRGHSRGPGVISGFGHGAGRGFGRGFGAGFGGGFGGYDDGYDLAELYRQLYNNLPYFALHPPVYYSEPVPRTYGYSPFAYPPGVMTPDVVEESKPVTIVNPYVPGTKPASTAAKTDRSASTATSPEPLLIMNPFVTPNREVAKSGS